MMSATVMFWMRRPSAPCSTAAPADWYRKNASTIVISPSEDSALANTHSPNSPTTSANTCPERPAACVARLRSPVRHHTSARAMRPPSSGNAGTTLNRNSAALMKPSQPSSASAGVVFRPPRVSATSETVPLLASTAIVARQSRNSASVTASPAAAIFSSSPALWGSRRICESPPKNHRSMPTIGIPRRRAASACPSSCSTSEAK